MMNPIRVNVGDRPVLVLQPDSPAPGPLSVDLLATVNRARAEGAGVCVLPSGKTRSASVLELTLGDAPVVCPGGAAGAWLRARASGAAVASRTKRLLRGASSTFSQEWYRELRRHAGDERLPSDLRVTLREKAQRSLVRSVAAARDVAPFPRRLLRQPVHAALPPARLAEAREAATSLGITRDRPIAAFEGRRRPDTFAAAITWLVQRGYSVVRIGEGDEPMSAGVVDLTGRGSALVQLFVLMNARFVVCESVDLQHVAYLTNTASLLVNARDPFRAYPVRPDSLFTLSTPIDLETGAPLAAGDQLHDGYFRNLRNYGFRDNSADQVLAAVREMHQVVTSGWEESERQAQFRNVVTTAGAALAPAVPFVAQWGPDAGFLGGGRLAAWQADKLTL